MPFTLLHMGPAVLIKSAGGGRFSFIVFGITQVFIDLESGYNLLQGNWPVHQFLHTLLGATVAALICCVIGKPIGERLLRLWNRRLSDPQQRWLGVQTEISWLAAASGAIIGAYSHIVLDGIMHSDLRPAAPWSETNPLLHWVSISYLHWFCIASGVLGMLILLAVRWRKKTGPP